MQIGIVIGRFQGFTKAHFKLIETAALESDKVLVMIGSANRRKSIKNPWTAEERIDAIKKCLDSWEHLNKLEFIPINDYPDQDIDWVENVSEKVYSTLDSWSNGEWQATITVFGCLKDESSFYLEHFPDWRLGLTTLIEGVDATEVRKLWFIGKQTIQYLRDFEPMHPLFGNWLFDQTYNSNLQEEWDFYQKEKERFKDYPYPETLNFCCADAVLIHNGYVLLIERGAAPGKGCWALPGGFKNNNETFLQAAIRELKEEAGIQMSDEDLESCIRHHDVFDNPTRSLGIPRISYAYLFDLTYGISNSPIKVSLPRIVAGDDAVNYRWTNIADIPNLNDIYDDHALIINRLNGFKTHV